jgi:hypothetical protein
MKKSPQHEPATLNVLNRRMTVSTVGIAALAQWLTSLPLGVAKSRLRWLFPRLQTLRWRRLLAGAVSLVCWTAVVASGRREGW